MQKIGLMVMDMQRDFCDHDGVFALNGFDVSGIQEIIPRIARVMEVCKQRRIPTIATKLTILQNLDGSPMGMGHLKTLRPFLAESGFRDGSAGQRLIPQIPEPDYQVRKWGHSAMYMTELEKIIRSLELEQLVFVGIATNGVVEGTAREAVARGFHITTLRDCVAGYNMELHEASLKNLRFFGEVVSSETFLHRIGYRADDPSG